MVGARTFSDADMAEIESAGADSLSLRIVPPPGVGQYMYWRKADGWIVTGPAWPQEYARMVQKGMQPLDRYGRFGDEPKLWDIRKQPYKHLLERGGAKEFAVRQILEHGWHRKPPMKGVTFPQLAGVEHQDVVCEFCKRPYLSEEDLHRHQSIAHKERAQNQQLARIIKDASEGGNDQMAQALGMLAQAISTLGGRLNEIEARLPDATPEVRPGRKAG